VLNRHLRIGTKGPSDEKPYGTNCRSTALPEGSRGGLGREQTDSPWTRDGDEDGRYSPNPEMKRGAGSSIDSTGKSMVPVKCCKAGDDVVEAGLGVKICCYEGDG